MRINRLVWIGIILAALCFQPMSLSSKPSSKGGLKSEIASPPSLHIEWKRLIDQPLSITTSSDGKFVTAVMKNGVIQCFGADGSPVWSRQLKDVDKVVAGIDGSAIAYSYLNPVKTTVYLLDKTGAISWQHEIQGAVWSSAASPIEGLFAIGTGERYVYIYTFTKTRQRYKRWRIPGVPCTMSFDRTGQSLIMGAWQEAGVGVFSLAGKQIRWSKGQGDRLHYVQYSSGGNHEVIVAKPNRDIAECSISYADMDLNEIWRKELNVYNPRIDISPNGEYVAVGYLRPITHKGEEIRENRIALYTRNGRMLWEKGGLFAKWNLLQILSDGDLLMYDDTPSLYVLDQSGQILEKKKLNSKIRTFVKDISGDRIVTYCGDGQLCVYSIK